MILQLDLGKINWKPSGKDLPLSMPRTTFMIHGKSCKYKYWQEFGRSQILSSWETLRHPRHQGRKSADNKKTSIFWFLRWKLLLVKMLLWLLNWQMDSEYYVKLVDKAEAGFEKINFHFERLSTQGKRLSNSTVCYRETVKGRVRWWGKLRHCLTFKKLPQPHEPSVTTTLMNQQPSI